MPIQTAIYPISPGTGYNDSILLYRIFNESTTWVAPMTGVIDVMLIAGHGGGAAARTNAANTYLIGGAGAGEMALKLAFPVTAGQSYDITIGAGGAALSVPSGSITVVSGGSGSESKFVGSGINMQVNPGAGGTSTYDMYDCYGGEGGYGGYGGDLHFPGGRGGMVSSRSTGPSGATGSGAVNLVYCLKPGATSGPESRPIDFIEHTRGGDRSSGGTFGMSYGPTGGGGCGGHGGDIIAGTLAAASSLTGGGGYGGNAASLIDGQGTAFGFGGPSGDCKLPASAIQGLSLDKSLALWMTNFAINIFGGGNGGSTPAANAAPAGGGGCGATTASVASRAGFMGGMGGVYSTAAVTGQSGAGLCAPGQSVISYGTSTTTAVAAGTGGSGMCLLVLRKAWK